VAKHGVEDEETIEEPQSLLLEEGLFNILTVHLEMEKEATF